MGCDIHAYSEKKRSNGSHDFIADVLDNRDYKLFAFLADVRNYANHVMPIVAPRGIPVDVSSHVKDEYESWGCDAHTPSWVSIDELINFDYTQPIRYNRMDATYAEYLGSNFVNDIIRIIKSDADRIVFFFDN